MEKRRQVLSAVAATVVTVLVGGAAAGCSSGQGKGIFGLARATGTRTGAPSAAADPAASGTSVSPTELKARLLTAADLPGVYQIAPGGQRSGIRPTSEPTQPDVGVSGTGPDCDSVSQPDAMSDGGGEPYAAVVFVGAAGGVVETIDVSSLPPALWDSAIDNTFQTMTSCSPLTMPIQGQNVAMTASPLALPPLGDHSAGIRLTGRVGSRTLTENMVELRSGQLGMLVVVAYVGPDTGTTVDIVTHAYDRLTGRPVPRATDTSGAV